MEWSDFEAVRQVVALAFDLYGEVVRRADPVIQMISRSVAGKRVGGFYGFEYRGFSRGSDDMIVLGATAIFLGDILVPVLDRLVLDITWDRTGVVELRREILGDCGDASQTAQLQRIIVETCSFLHGLRAEHVTDFLTPSALGGTRRLTMRYP
jgi:hypothetical protein